MKEWVMMPHTWVWNEIDHYTVPHSLRRVCGFFNVSHIYYMWKGSWDGSYGLSSLSEKTRKSNRLQKSLQRQHLKTMSVALVRPGFEPTASRSADRRLSHWANRARRWPSMNILLLGLLFLQFFFSFSIASFFGLYIVLCLYEKAYLLLFLFIFYIFSLA